MAERDCYKTLGVSRSADEQEIKRAYRKLAKKYHPDTNQGDKQAEQKFKEATEAYDILGNPEKKKIYDQYGMAAFDGSMGNPSGAGNPFSQGSYTSGFGNTGQYTEYHYSSGDVNMEDIFEKFFGGMFGGRGTGRNFRDGFKRAYGNNSYGYQQGSGTDSYGYQKGFDHNPYGSQPGRDLHAEMEITLEEAAFGCDKVLHLRGTRQEKLQVHIPAGINEGQSVRLRGKGQPGWGGTPAGDLLIKVHILENSVYERRGMDVYTTISVPYRTAVQGGEAYVQTLYGTVKCTIPPGVKPGGRIRLRNKGIVSMKNSNMYGDEYVTIQIRTSE